MDPNLMMMDNHTMPMPSMHMTFYASNEVTILFDGWKVKTGWQMLLSFLCVFIMAFLYELLKTFRERYAIIARHRSFESLQSTSEKHTIKTYHISRIDALVQTLLQAVSFTLAYFLMLIVMTYNGYLFLAVVLGDAFGYYMTLHLRPAASSTSSSGDHCH